MANDLGVRPVDVAAKARNFGVLQKEPEKFSNDF
jgi:hypothetical protein